MKTWARYLLTSAAVVGLAGLHAPVLADEMLIVRSARDFEETMTALQSAISARGYRVTRVQRVDVGLEAKGYTTDKYRVVFYGKADEVARLVERYPDMIPFLPLNVAIFSEGSQTLITTNRPRALATLFPAPELKPVFEQWEQDLVAVFEEVHRAR